MKYLIPALLIFLPLYIFAGDDDRIPIETNILKLPQGFQYNALSGNGYNIHFNEAVSNISGVNPASIYIFQNIAAGLSYQFSTKIDKTWESNNFIDFERSAERSKLEIPQSAGMVIPFGNFSVGIGFNQSYNLNTVSGPIKTQVSKPEDPYTPIDTVFNIESETIAYAYSLTASYLFKSLLSRSDQLSLGANFSYNSIQDAEKGFGHNETYYLSGFLWSLGLIYNFQTNYSLGLYYEHGDKFQTELFKGYYLTSNFQDKVHLGIQVVIAEPIKFYGDVSYIQCDDTRVDNQFDYSLGFVYKPLKIFSCSAGFFTNRFSYKNEETKPLSEPLSNNAYFLTAGIKFFLQAIEIELALADSHLFSSEFRKQTLLKLSAAYSF